MSNSHVVSSGGSVGTGVVMADGLAEAYAESGDLKRQKLIIDTDPGIGESFFYFLLFCFLVFLFLYFDTSLSF